MCLGIRNTAVVSKRYVAQKALLRAYRRDLNIECASSDESEAEVDDAPETLPELPQASAPATPATAINTRAVLPPIGRLSIIAPSSIARSVDCTDKCNRLACQRTDRPGHERGDGERGEGS